MHYVKRGWLKVYLQFTHLLVTVCVEKKLDQARKVFDLMVTKGCETDVYVYKCYDPWMGIVKRKKLVKHFEEISSKGLLIPDIVVCTPSNRLYTPL